MNYPEIIVGRNTYDNLSGYEPTPQTAASRVPLTQSSEQTSAFNTGSQAFQEPMRMDTSNLIFNPNAPRPMNPSAFDFFKNSTSNQSGNGLFGSTKRY